MGLRQLKSSLRDEVMSAKHVRTYDAAREREPALAAHAGVLSVLAVLGDETDRRYGEREALTRALVREHQRAAESFWSAALILAYTPMLFRLRGRICGDAFGRDDLDQMVVMAFLEAVAAFPLAARPTRVAMYLRQDTQRAVFRRICAEQTARQRLGALTDLAERDPHFEVFTANTADDQLDEEERAELTALLLSLGGHQVPSARLDAVAATHVGGESLREYVARTHPGLDEAALETAYQRVKRERLRTLAKLRPLLDDAVSHRDAQSALRRESAAP